MTTSNIEPRTALGPPAKASSPHPLSATTAAAVALWAMTGAAILVYQLYIWTKWITGPTSSRWRWVRHPTDWIKATVTSGKSLGAAAAGLCLVLHDPVVGAASDESPPTPYWSRLATAVLPGSLVQLPG